MKRTNAFFGLLCCATLAFAASCGADSGKTGDAGEDIYAEDTPCAGKYAYPHYTPGMKMTADDLTITLVSADPAPPRQQMVNNWALSVTDSSGAPVSDFKITTAGTWMPVHQHPGRTPPNVQVGGDPGQFKLNNVSFTMRGPWLVNFTVVPANGKSSAVNFEICVE